MTHILVCTDGSVYAHSVYDHAAWAAARTAASVEVLHVIDHKRESASVADFSGTLGVDSRDELLQQLAELDVAKGKVAQARGRAILEDAQARLREGGVDRVTLTQRHGSLIETLGEVERGADLVVVGKRGEAADFATLHLGANLERVIRGSRHPVLVASRAFQPIERVLIAYDGGPSARKAVDHACNGKLLPGLEVHLLMVGPDNAQSRERLDAARAKLAASGMEARVVLHQGEPETLIPAYVQEHGIDLLVVGAYGHSRIRNLIVGSTTTELIRTCRVPLLMFR